MLLRHEDETISCRAALSNRSAYLMEHAYAVEHRLVEQYLLNELSPEARDTFEEHFFDCQKCAADLRTTDAFLKAARTELQQIGQTPKLQIVSRRKSFSLLQWGPALAISALAACLVVMFYQNLVTFPRLRSDVARVDAPAILPSVSLVGGNSRGGSVPSTALNGAKSVLLQVDIPTQNRFSRYICSLYTPQHQLIWAVEVSAEQAKDTVSIRAPLREAISGTYTLEVQGDQSADSSTSTSGSVLASYSFTLNAGASGAGQ
jgi:hypothetical protein